MEQCRLAILQAVGRGFAATSEFSKSSSPTSAAGAVAATPKRRKMAPRRSADELAALSQKLYEQVCAAPGTTMAARALRLKTPAQTLQLSMSTLKGDGKVRHVGERNQARFSTVRSRCGRRVTMIKGDVGHCKRRRGRCLRCRHSRSASLCPAPRSGNSGSQTPHFRSNQHNYCVSFSLLLSL